METGSMNFDGQALHVEAEEEFEREDRERQNQLKDLLTSEFDDNLEDSDSYEDCDDDDANNNNQVFHGNSNNNITSENSNLPNNQYNYNNPYNQPGYNDNNNNGHEAINGVIDPLNNYNYEHDSIKENYNPPNQFDLKHESYNDYTTYSNEVNDTIVDNNDENYQKNKEDDDLYSQYHTQQQPSLYNNNLITQQHNLITLEECNKQIEQVKKENESITNTLRKNMGSLKEQFISEVRINQHRYNILQDEKNALQSQLTQLMESEASLKDDKMSLQNQLEVVSTELQALKTQHQDQTRKLMAAESLVDEFKSQLSSMNSNEVLTRMRVLHERATEALTNKHQQQLDSLNNKLQQAHLNVSQQKEELKELKDRHSQLQKDHQQRELANSDNIHRLTMSLHQSQQQCNALLDSGANTEVARLKIQLKEVTISKENIEKLNDDLKFKQELNLRSNKQMEVADLKEQLQIMTSNVFLNQLDTQATYNRLGTPNSLNDSYHMLNINLSSEGTEDKFDNKDNNNNKDINVNSNDKKTIERLKSELQMTLALLKKKRIVGADNDPKQLKVLRKEMEEKNGQLEQMRNQLKFKEEEIKVLQTRMGRIDANPSPEDRNDNQILLDEKDNQSNNKDRLYNTTNNARNTNARCDGRCLTAMQLKTALERKEKEVVASKKELEEKRAMLNEFVDRMNHLVEQHRVDKIQAVNRRSSELEEEYKKRTHNLTQAHEARVQELKQELAEMDVRCSEAEQLYIECCKAKQVLEGQKDQEILEMKRRFEEEKLKEITRLKDEWRGGTKERKMTNDELMDGEGRKKNEDDIMGKLRMKLKEMERIMVEKNNEINEKDKELVEKNIIVDRLNKEISALKKQITNYHNNSLEDNNNNNNKNNISNEIISGNNNAKNKNSNSDNERIKSFISDETPNGSETEELLRRKDNLIKCLEEDVVQLKLMLQINKKKFHDCQQELLEKSKKEEVDVRKEIEWKMMLQNKEEQFKKMSEEEIRKHEEEKLEMQRNYEETMKAKLTSLDHTWALRLKTTAHELSGIEPSDEVPNMLGSIVATLESIIDESDSVHDFDAIIEVINGEIKRWKMVVKKCSVKADDLKVDNEKLISNVGELERINEELKKEKYEGMKEFEKVKSTMNDKITVLKQENERLSERMADGIYNKGNEVRIIELMGSKEKLEEKLKRAEKLFKSMQNKFQKHLDHLLRDQQQIVVKIKTQCEDKITDVNIEWGKKMQEVNDVNKKLEEKMEELNDEIRVIRNERDELKRSVSQGFQLRSNYEHVSSMKEELEQEEIFEKKMRKEKKKIAVFLRKYYIEVLRNVLRQHDFGEDFLENFVESVENSLDKFHRTSSLQQTSPNFHMLNQEALELFDQKVKHSPTHPHPFNHAHHSNHPSLSNHQHLLTTPNHRNLFNFQLKETSKHHQPNHRTEFSSKYTKDQKPSPHPPVSYGSQRHRLIMQSFEDINKLCFRTSSDSTSNYSLKEDSRNERTYKNSKYTPVYLISEKKEEKVCGEKRELKSALRNNTTFRDNALESYFDANKRSSPDIN